MIESKFRHVPLGWKAKDIKLLRDLEDDFNTELALKEFNDFADYDPSQSRAGFKILEFSF